MINETKARLVIFRCLAPLSLLVATLAYIWLNFTTSENEPRTAFELIVFSTLIVTMGFCVSETLWRIKEMHVMLRGVSEKSAEQDRPVEVEEFYGSENVLKEAIGDIDAVKKIRIYIGLDDRYLVDSLLECAPFNCSVEAYINPQLIWRFFDSDGNSRFEGVHILVAFSPLDQCAIYRYTDERRSDVCHIIRQFGENESYTLATVHPSHFLTHLEDTYFDHFGKKHASVVNGCLYAHFIIAVAKLRKRQEALLVEKTFAFQFREVQYYFAKHISEKARESILAIDQTPLNEWRNTEYLHQYLEASNRDGTDQENLKSKVRVHVYDPSEMGELKDYNEYIDLMENSNFELRFIRKSDFHSFGGKSLDGKTYKSADEGQVIFDEEICFRAFEDHNKGQQSGQVTIRKNDVKDFVVLFHKVSRKALSKNDFLKLHFNVDKS